MPIQPSAPGTFPLRERDVYTVSRLNREVRGLLDRMRRFKPIRQEKWIDRRRFT